MENLKQRSSIILVGEAHEVIEELNRKLKHEVPFYSASENAEVNQLSDKFQKTSLLFSNPQSCVHFLKNAENNPLLSEVRMYLVMDRNGKFKTETEEVLKEAGVQIFIPRLFDEFMEDLKAYLLT